MSLAFQSEHLRNPPAIFEDNEQEEQKIVETKGKHREPNASELQFCFLVHLCGITYEKASTFASGLGYKPPSTYRFYKASSKIHQVLALLVLVSIYRALHNEDDSSPPLPAIQEIVNCNY